jgi:CrcB protein
VLWVGLGGFLGAMGRYWVDGLISATGRGAFPWGTWVVNVSGCFLVGLLASVLTERLLPAPTLRVALTVGFVGAYTTFSTFAYETVRLGQDGAVGLALLNVGLSVVAGVGAAWLGLAAGRAL